MYLGHYPCHAGSVALVLKLSSGMVSPQYHVVFDDKFTTVKYLQSSEEPPNWQELFTHHIDRSTDEQQKLAEELLQPHIV